MKVLQFVIIFIFVGTVRCRSFTVGIYLDDFFTIPSLVSSTVFTFRRQIPFFARTLYVDDVVNMIAKVGFLSCLPFSRRDKNRKLTLATA
uniref:Uncharacterized protein n=1 Tax=Anopheles funestus TaxID=62324 RepID=A0A182S3S6_ANOFN